MKYFSIVLSIIVCALIGGVSAFWMAGLVGNARPVGGLVVSVEGWHSNWDIGSRATSPYVRAYVAKHGLLALPKSEAVYFIRAEDDDGQPLREACDYILSGEAQAADWWSITLYDSDDWLPVNNDGALSIDQTRVGGAEWSALVSSNRPQTDQFWLSSKNAGSFDVMIRLYVPTPALLADPQTHFQPPSVKRIGCEEAV